MEETAPLTELEVGAPPDLARSDARLRKLDADASLQRGCCACGGPFIAVLGVLSLLFGLGAWICSGKRRRNLTVAATDISRQLCARLPEKTGQLQRFSFSSI
jgi:hypothetical protein